MACNFSTFHVPFGTLNISGIDIKGKAVMAPMAGITDNAFRIMVRSMGASLVFTEMVSSDGLVRNSKKTHRFLEFGSEERPIGIQIFGSDPVIMADAAQIVEQVKPEFIDLNFGCPASKVVKGGAGAALLNDLSKLRVIVKAVVSAVKTPVTAKIRSGWNDGSIVAVQASRMIENEGAYAVTVHPRTKQVGFSGLSDWDLIKQVKSEVRIPVIGNGDVYTPEDAESMLQQTQCDLVMIGRGALGRPWLFSQINTFLSDKEKDQPIPYPKRIDICLKHYDLALKHIGGERAVKEMRKHIGWYLKGMPKCTQIRQQVFHMLDPDEVKETLIRYGKSL